MSLYGYGFLLGPMPASANFHTMMTIIAINSCPFCYRCCMCRLIQLPQQPHWMILLLCPFYRLGNQSSKLPNLPKATWLGAMALELEVR